MAGGRGRSSKGLARRRGQLDPWAVPECEAKSLGSVGKAKAAIGTLADLLRKV